MEIIEVWKEIPNFEDYEISTKGNIRYKNNKKEKHKSYCRDRYMVSLNGKSLYVHRLVAQTFIPNPNNYTVVNHIDEDPLNNHVDNLEWCTQKHNINHGTCQQRRSEKVRKCTILEYDSNGVLIKEYPSLNWLHKNGFTAIWHRIARNSNNRLYNGHYWIRSTEVLDDFTRNNISIIKTIKLPIK